MRDVTAKLIHAAAEWVATAKQQLPEEQRRAIDEYLVHDFKELVLAMQLGSGEVSLTLVDPEGGNEVLRVRLAPKCDDQVH
jgi:hypothetical protein